MKSKKIELKRLILQGNAVILLIISVFKFLNYNQYVVTLLKSTLISNYYIKFVSLAIPTTELIIFFLIILKTKAYFLFINSLIFALYSLFYFKLFLLYKESNCSCVGLNGSFDFYIHFIPYSLFSIFDLLFFLYLNPAVKNKEL